MKSLYGTEYFHYTPDATDIAERIIGVVRPIFKEYMDKGYNPREIAHVMLASIWDAELEEIMDIKDALAKQQK